jgi:hypothetical protein
VAHANETQSSYAASPQVSFWPHDGSYALRTSNSHEKVPLRHLKTF